MPLRVNYIQNMRVSVMSYAVKVAFPIFDTICVLLSIPLSRILITLEEKCVINLNNGRILRLNYLDKIILISAQFVFSSSKSDAFHHEFAFVVNSHFLAVYHEKIKSDCQ